MNERVAVFYYTDRATGKDGSWRVSVHPEETEADMRAHAAHFRPDIRVNRITFEQQEDGDGQENGR